jgi:hypothetical protein
VAACLPAGFCCCWLLLLAEYHSDAIQINPSHETSEWLRHAVRYARYTLLTDHHTDPD